MDSKLKTYLGFASKAGKLLFGMAKAAESAKRGKTGLIVYASDISPKSQKELLFTAKQYNVQAMLLPCTTDELENATGRKGSVISVEDDSFAKAVKERLNSIKENQEGTCDGKIQN
ncbi:MAG: ribosomal L7Ae/L30e/S12e/Gadd45 family protein [Clostridiales bacterium]|nr:ribosomal L7Ae/L30e/S12e/Gadd45 family protein [Candidatus Equinaster intestinalis]